MLYTIQKINRTVELDDNLVDKYTQFKNIRDNLFVIAIALHYKESFTDSPNVPDISDEELSAFCNKTLAEDMEIMRDNALIVQNIHLLQPVITSDVPADITILLKTNS
ncbi:MAG: hypothetical protein IJ794_10165 [Lachnospiraceae bacterium]|nr:hypothetical protein [Lachnospiraceae bacterium]